MTVRITRRERNLTLAGVLVVFLLGALDQTIVSTAMPRIIEQLDGLNLYTWVTTGYLLASTVMVPIYGKLSDMYGRKPILIFGVLLFLGGSMLSGLAGEFGNLPLLGGGMTQLIAFRALQGLGGAALFSSAFAIIADLIPASERGKYQGLFGGVFGLASVVGPIIGGFFTDHGTVSVLGHVIAGWRWVFYVNLPIGAVALYMIATQMPALAPGDREGSIDLPGAALIVSTFVPLLLALTWGGSVHPWGSATILTLLGVAAASLALFVWVERRARDPLLSLDLFRIPVFAFANAAAFVVNVAFLGIVMFLPLFMQLVLGITATNSGFTLLPLMGGLILSSMVAGLVVTRTGRYKPLMLGGAAVLIVGVALLTQIDLHTTMFGLAWRMVVVGIGLGPAQSLFTLAIQNAVPFRQMGVATGASQFFRQIGSAIGLAVFGTLLTLSVQREVPKFVPSIPGAAAQSFDLSSIGAGGAGGGIEQGVARALAALEARVTDAVGGDAAAAAALQADATVPAQVKALVAAAPGLSEEARGAALQELDGALQAQSATLAEQIGQGVKQGFAVSIRLLFQVSFFVIVAGSLLILFIPGLPLRTTVASEEAARAPAEADAQEDGGAGGIAPVIAPVPLPEPLV